MSITSPQTTSKTMLRILVLLVLASVSVYVLTGIKIWLLLPFVLVTGINYRNVRVGLFMVYWNVFNPKHRLRIQLWGLEIDVDLDSKSQKSTRKPLSALKSYLLRFILSHLSFSIHLHSVAIQLKSKGAKFGELRFDQVKINTRSFRDKDGTSWRLEHYILLEGAHFDSEKVTETLTVNISYAVSLSFELSNLSLGMNVRRLQFPLLLICSSIANSARESKSSGSKDTSDSSSSLDDLLSATLHCLKSISAFSQKVDSISVTLLDVVCTDIHPFLIWARSHNLKRLFNNRELFDGSKFRFSAAKFTLNALRVPRDLPGYAMVFAGSPLQFITSAVNVRLRATLDEKDRELFLVPNANISITSNALSETVRVIEERKQLTLAVVRLLGHVSAPTVEFDLEYLGVLFAEFKRVKAHCKSLRPEKTTSKDSNLRFENAFMLYEHISQFLPIISAKMTIEDFRILIKTTSENVHVILAGTNLMCMELLTKKKLASQDRSSFATNVQLKTDISGSSIIYQEWYSSVLEPVDGGFSDERVSEEIFVSEHISMRVGAEELPDAKVSSVASIDTVSIDLLSLPALCGISTVFESVANHGTSRLSRRPEKMPKQSTDMKKEILEDHISQLFRSPPDWLRLIRFEGTSLTLLLGARSVLLPPEKMKSARYYSKNETVQQSLRKLRIEMDLWLAVFSETQRQSKAESVSGSEASYIAGSEKSGLYQNIDGFWSVDFDFSKIAMVVIACDPRYFKKNRIKKENKADSSSSANFLEVSPNYRHRLMKINLLEVPSIKACLKSIDCSEGNRLWCSVNIPETEFVYSAFSQFIILSAISLVKNTIFSFKKPKESSTSSSGYKDSLLDFLIIDVSLESVDAVLHFPLDLKLRLQIQAFAAHVSQDHTISLSSTSIRVCAQSPTVRGMWERIFVAHRVSSDMQLTHLIEVARLGKQGLNLESNELLIGEIRVESARLSVPYQFIIHRLFDNIGVLKKVNKQLAWSFKNNLPEIILNPKPVIQAPVVPKVRFKAGRFLFNMEDDPFETDLGAFYQAGLIEQRARMAKLDFFAQKFNEKWPNLAYKETSCFGGYIKVDNHIFHHNGGVFEGGGSKVDLKDCGARLDALQRHILRLWIRRIRALRSQIASETEKSDFLWKPAGSRKYNRRVLDPTTGPPLLSGVIEDVDLTILSVDFDLKKLPEYLHSIGKGVPMDMKYNMLVPIHLDLKLRELRAHLRDYPLPLIYMPGKEGSDYPIEIQGNAVIAEEFNSRKESINNMFIPLVPLCEYTDKDPYFLLNVPKSLTSVKTFLNISFTLKSLKSTRFVWGASIQPAIQQVMLNFDGFTKPPLDPSDKVGFWDKLRANIHGRANFSLKALDIIFKGSRDPYKALGNNAGFMLSFSEAVEVSVNRNDNPLEFIVVKLKYTRWAVPNHVVEPLLVWSRLSADSVILAKEKGSRGSTLAGYYLQHGDGAADIINKVIPEYYDKIVINLAGGVDFLFGASFERKLGEGRSSDFIPHYKVLLTNPEYVNDPNYDAYEGFRSHFIHLSFQLKSQGQYNGVHLSPGMFNSFFQWWKLFGGNMSLPVRHGKIFGPAKATKKFSVFLDTIKYKFGLSPVYACHVYRDELVALENSQEHSVGFKGKLESVNIELHQVKQNTMIKKVGGSEKTTKMVFTEGLVDVESVDIRLIRARFGQKGLRNFDDDQSWYDINDFQELGTDSVETASVDIIPFVYTPRMMYFRRTKDSAENGENSLFSGVSSVEAQIELTRKRLEELKKKQGQGVQAQIDEVQKNYNTLKAIRRGDDDKRTSHNLRKTMMLQNTAAEADFNNRFIVHNMMLKWNIRTRDAVFQYAHLLRVHKSVGHYMTHSAISSILEVSGKEASSDLESSQLRLFEEKEDLGLETFEQDIRRVFGDLFTNDDYLIKLVSPQIQMIDKEDSDTCMMVVAPSIEVKVILVYKLSKLEKEKSKKEKKEKKKNNDEKSQSNNETKETNPFSDTVLAELDPSEDLSDLSFTPSPSLELLETRIAAFLHSANVLSFYKEQVLDHRSFYFLSSSYGTKSLAWPPFLGVELCTNGTILKDNMMLEKTLMAARVDSAGNTVSRDEKDQRSTRLSLNVPSVVVLCDLRQYTTLYLLLWDLLIYSEPGTKALSNKLEKLAMKTALGTTETAVQKVKQLQKDIRVLEQLERDFSVKKGHLDKTETEEAAMVSKEKLSLLQELYSLMKAIMLGRGQQNVVLNEQSEWLIKADLIICHMLIGEREPFIDVALSKSRFLRRENLDMLNENELFIGMIQGFVLRQGTYFPEILAPFSEATDTEDGDIMTVKWSMRKPIGGIRVMKHLDIFLKPLKLQLDQETGKAILEYVFMNEKLGGFAEVIGSNDEESGSEKSSGIIGLDSDDEGVDTMLERANSNVNIELMTLNLCVLCVSYKGEGKQKMVSVNQFVLTLPNIEIMRQVMLFYEVLMFLKKVVIKALLQHSGKLIGNKLRRHRVKRAKQPLKPLTKYSRFVSLEELKDRANTDEEEEEEEGNEDDGYERYMQEGYELEESYEGEDEGNGEVKPNQSSKSV